MPKAPHPDDNLKAQASVSIVLAALESDSTVKAAIVETRKYFPMMAWHHAVQFLTGKRFAKQMASIESYETREQWLLAQRIAFELGTDFGWSGACPLRPEMLDRIRLQLRVRSRKANDDDSR